MTVDVHSSQTATLIRAVEEASSPAALVTAVRNLAGAIAIEGIPTLIKVLGYNNPGAAVAAVEGLVVLGDAAVTPLMEQIDGYNYGARAWAIRALARIAHPDALETLVTAAREDFSLSVRRAAAKGLGFIRWDLVPVSDRSSQQQTALEALLVVCHDPEWVVRYGAIAGLQTLAPVFAPDTPAHHNLGATLHSLATQDDTPAVRARAIFALQQLSKAS